MVVFYRDKFWRTTLMRRAAACKQTLLNSAPVVNRVPESWSTLLGSATYEDVVGLTANRAVSAEGWESIIYDRKLNEGIAELEPTYLLESSRKPRDRLRGRKLLADHHHLSVVFCDESSDLRKVHKYGVEHNNGTEEARKALRKHIDHNSAIYEAGTQEHVTLPSAASFGRPVASGRHMMCN